MTDHLLPGERLFEDFKEGDRVSWLRESRGGYGHVEKIAGTVLRETPSGRFRIKLEDGSVTVVTKARLMRAEDGAK